MRRLDAFELTGMTGRPLDHCLVIDVHGHLGDIHGFTSPDSSIQSVIDKMDRMGTDIWCPSSYACAYGHAQRGNDMIIDAVSRFPTRIFGYMCAEVGYAETIVPELERCLAAGLRAVKIHSFAFLYNSPAYQPVFEFANHHGLPLLAHTWMDETLPHLEPQFDRYKRVNFVLAHAGCGNREHYARLAKDYANVYLETVLSLCPRGGIEYFVGQGLAKKLLWGTDTTFVDPAPQLGRVLFAQISEVDKQAILGENAARVLGIRPPLDRQGA